MLRRTGVSARTSAGVYVTPDPARDQLGLALLPEPPVLVGPLLMVRGGEYDGDEYDL